MGVAAFKSPLRTLSSLERDSKEHWHFVLSRNWPWTVAIVCFVLRYKMLKL